MPHETFNVLAQWDAEASVWVAESTDIPGLITEADTLEALERKLEVMIPELVQENDLHETLSSNHIPVHVKETHEYH